MLVHSIASALLSSPFKPLELSMSSWMSSPAVSPSSFRQSLTFLSFRISQPHRRKPHSFDTANRFPTATSTVSALSAKHLFRLSALTPVHLQNMAAVVVTRHLRNTATTVVRHHLQNMVTAVVARHPSLSTLLRSLTVLPISTASFIALNQPPPLPSSTPSSSITRTIAYALRHTNVPSVALVHSTLFEDSRHDLLPLTVPPGTTSS